MSRPPGTLVRSPVDAAALTGRSLALIGPDGSGKSTLAAALAAASPAPTVTIYMGLYQRGMDGGRSRRVRLPAWDYTRRLVRQRARWEVGRWHRRRGRLVVYDRYGTDARLRPPSTASRARRWRRLLLAVTCPPPDLIVLLDAPGDVLAERLRSPLASAVGQRNAYRELAERLPNIVVVDATLPVDELSALLLSAVARPAARKPRS